MLTRSSFVSTKGEKKEVQMTLKQVEWIKCKRYRQIKLQQAKVLVKSRVKVTVKQYFQMYGEQIYENDSFVNLRDVTQN